MNTEQKIEILRKEAAGNKAANALFHAFAVRQRARFRINMNTLVVKMKHEGYEYSSSDYAPVLKLMADLGFGSLDIDSKGRIKGLKDIKTTLQSIGKAACGEMGYLSPSKHRNRFLKIGTVQREAPKPTAIKSLEEINISMSVGGKQVKVSMPGDLDPLEIARIIEGIQSRQAG